jgi:hypothetical protein
MLMKFVLVAMTAALVPVLAVEGAEGPIARCAVASPADGAELARKLCEGDALVKKHCTTCHSEGRITVFLQENGSRDTGYEKEMKNLILRKIRMTNGDISRQDGRKILDYLVVVWQRQKPASNT